MGNIDEKDYDDLCEAKRRLECTSLATKITDKIGKPIEYSLQKMPSGAQETIGSASQTALIKATDCACWTLSEKGNCRNWLHKFVVSGTGAVGGAFGLPGLAFELPASTTIMLRSIAAIARAEGENLNDPEARLSCVQVFALGGSATDDDAMDSSYLITRYALANEVKQAAAWVATQTSRKKSAPALVRFIQAVAARFGVMVEQKVAAELLPIVGAFGGSALNLLFIDHFQDKAMGHFTYRRLERQYGWEAVEETYQSIPVSSFLGRPLRPALLANTAKGT